MYRRFTAPPPHQARHRREPSRHRIVPPLLVGPTTQATQRTLGAVPSSSLAPCSSLSWPVGWWHFCLSGGGREPDPHPPGETRSASSGNRPRPCSVKHRADRLVVSPSSGVRQPGPAGAPEGRRD